MKNYIRHYKPFPFGRFTTHVVFLELLLCLFLAGCKKDPIEPHPNVKARKTVIVYIGADNNLASYSKEDIREMKAAQSDIPKDCNLVIYCDDNKEPYILKLEDGETFEEERMSERNSSDPEEFYNTLKMLITRYPADSYGLILWSHASGWTPSPKRAFGIDEHTSSSNYGAQMEISDMQLQLERLGEHWDYIFFDACFMQCIEVAYELRHVTDYIIASPAEIPGEGAPYDKIMKALFLDGEAAPREIANQYYNDQNTKYESYPYGYGLVLSVIKASELENLLKETKRLIPDFYEEAPLLPTDKIQAYNQYTTSKSERPEFLDMGSAMSKLLTEAGYNAWKEQMQRTVISRLNTPSWYTSLVWGGGTLPITDPEHNALVSIFIPNRKYDVYTDYNSSIKKTQWYKDFVK